MFYKKPGLRMSALLLALCGMPYAYAEKLEVLLPKFLVEHEQILSAQANVEKAEQNWIKAKADLMPSLSVTLSQGYEKQQKPSPPDTKTNRNTEELSLTQLVYDWGGTPAKVRSAHLSYFKSRMQKEITKQGLILQAAQSYLNLLRSVESLRYSQRSEANIKKQTGMEESRVKRGSGLSTDVLQTKSSLAGAMATRVRNEGAVVTSANRFKAVFREGIRLDALATPRIPFDKIPNTLEDALDIARRGSLNLKQAKIDIAIAQQAVRTAAAKIGPKLEFKGSAKHKHNDGGTMGTKEEYLAKIDLTMPIYAGGKNMAALRASRQALAAVQYTLKDLEYTIEERVRNSWQNLSTSRSNAQFLRNQANISGEFLDFARKERKLGTRSLLDVLNGETAYINALSSAVSAETDMAVAVFTLLQAMGELTADVFELEVIPSANPEQDNAIAPSVISPTAEASDAAAATRKIAARLENQRTENLPSMMPQVSVGMTGIPSSPTSKIKPVLPTQVSELVLEEHPASLTRLDLMEPLEPVRSELDMLAETQKLLAEMSSSLDAIRAEASLQGPSANIFELQTAAQETYEGAMWDEATNTLITIE